MFPNISNENEKAVGTLKPMVSISMSTKLVAFFVSDLHSTSVILGCDILDRYFEALKSRLTFIGIYDGSKVPMVKQPSKANKNVHLPE